MTADHAWDELYQRVEHLPPARMRQILRLVITELDSAAATDAGTAADTDDRSAARMHDALTWDELRASAQSLPRLDRSQFRSDVDSLTDEWVDLGGDA